MDSETNNELDAQQPKLPQLWEFSMSSLQQDSINQGEAHIPSALHSEVDTSSMRASNVPKLHTYNSVTTNPLPRGSEPEMLVDKALFETPDLITDPLLMSNSNSNSSLNMNKELFRSFSIAKPKNKNKSINKAEQVINSVTPHIMAANVSINRSSVSKFVVPINQSNKTGKTKEPENSGENRNRSFSTRQLLNISDSLELNGIISSEDQDFAYFEQDLASILDSESEIEEDTMDEERDGEVVSSCPIATTYNNINADVTIFDDSENELVDNSYIAPETTESIIDITSSKSGITTTPKTKDLKSYKEIDNDDDEEKEKNGRRFKLTTNPTERFEQEMVLLNSLYRLRELRLTKPAKEFAIFQQKIVDIFNDRYKNEHNLLMSRRVLRNFHARVMKEGKSMKEKFVKYGKSLDLNYFETQKMKFYEAEEEAKNRFNKGKITKRSKKASSIKKRNVIDLLYNPQYYIAVKLRSFVGRSSKKPILEVLKQFDSIHKMTLKKHEEAENKPDHLDTKAQDIHNHASQTSTANSNEEKVLTFKFNDLRDCPVPPYIHCEEESNSYLTEVKETVTCLMHCLKQTEGIVSALEGKS